MYDLIIIGGGPAGYSAALAAVKKEKKVLIIEKDKLGGTCLNRGCIPTKSLLNSSKLYSKSKKSQAFGVEFSELWFNFKQAFRWKNSVVDELRDNLSKLLSQKLIDIKTGEGIIQDSNSVEVGNDTFNGKNILIATGSIPNIPPIKGIDNALSSREILELKNKPKTITIIGGGVIGVEFASFFSSIGVDVNLLEIEKRLLPGMEKRISGLLEKSMGITCHLDSRVTGIDSSCVSFNKSGKEYKIESDIVLNAAGRVPDCNQFRDLGIVKENKVCVNDYMETDIKGIYAAGDVTGRSLLAHSAVYMGELAVENMFGEPVKTDLNAVPSVVYCDPEVASVGLTSSEIKSRGIPYLKSSFKLTLNGRYLAENGHDHSLCIVYAHRDTRIILGVHLIGSGVSEIVSSAVLAVKNSYTLEQFSGNILPHPTISEVIKDCMFFMK